MHLPDEGVCSYAKQIVDLIRTEGDNFLLEHELRLLEKVVEYHDENDDPHKQMPIPEYLKETFTSPR
jgi:hypothetical protein